MIEQLSHHTEILSVSCNSRLAWSQLLILSTPVILIHMFDKSRRAGSTHDGQ